jgi:hypothetical protein
MAKSSSSASAYIMDRIVDAWRKAHPDEDPTSSELADFALENGLLRPDQHVIHQWAQEKIRRALRDETHLDAQGRDVRVNHAYREMRIIDGEPKQLTLWAGADATPDKMERAVAWRRRSIADDCFKLWTDHDSYSKNNSHGAALKPLSLNFEGDVLDRQESSGSYPDERPYGEDEDDDES